MNLHLYTIAETDVEFGKLLVSRKDQTDTDLGTNLQIQEQTLRVFIESLVHCDFQMIKVFWRKLNRLGIPIPTKKIN